MPVWLVWSVTVPSTRRVYSLEASMQTRWQMWDRATSSPDTAHTTQRGAAGLLDCNWMTTGWGQLSRDFTDHLYARNPAAAVATGKERDRGKEGRRDRFQHDRCPSMHRQHTDRQTSSKPAESREARTDNWPAISACRRIEPGKICIYWNVRMKVWHSQQMSADLADKFSLTEIFVAIYTLFYTDQW